MPVPVPAPVRAPVRAPREAPIVVLRPLKRVIPAEPLPVYRHHALAVEDADDWEIERNIESYIAQETYQVSTIFFILSKASNIVINKVNLKSNKNTYFLFFLKKCRKMIIIF